MSQHPVQRRKVLYIPGFDPFHPRRYRELYRKQSADQAAISGYEIDQNAQEMGPYGWRVRSVQDGVEVHTQIEVLLWSDIVKDSMRSGILATYGQMLRTAFIYVRSGALWPLMRLRKGPVLAALYPVVGLIVQLSIAALLGWTGAQLAHALLPGGWVSGLAISLFALGVGYAVLRWFRARDNRLSVYYLMQDFAFSAGANGAYPAPLHNRLVDFAARLTAAMQSDVDEVLVVGHSSGAHMAVTVVSRYLRQSSPGGPALGFLSLGQVVPMVSFLPDAGALRRDLQYLSESDRVFWLDVTAPGDGASFALCDPVSVTGVARPMQKWPIVISAAFSQTMSPEYRAGLKRRFFRLHFQYLCAFDRPGDYDYFRITAGPLTLAHRFNARRSSKNKITRPRSPHRTVSQ